MRVAYLINTYPATSHSFIRREIRALERRDLTVARYALSPGGDLVDPQDFAECALTVHLKKQRLATLAKDCLVGAAARPGRSLRAFGLAWRIGRRSERGLLNHLAYLAEAAIIAAWCRRDKIDHLHAHFGTNSAAIAMLASVISGVPYSFTLHGPDEFDNPCGYGLAEKVRRAAFAVTVSSFGRSQLMRWCAPESWPKIKVVHCGLEPSFDNEGSAASAIPGRLLCVGRLTEQKGQAVLLDAAAALKREGCDFSLVLAGDGPLRGLLERRIADLGLDDHVKITGWISGERVSEELARAQALVLPSFAEGLPVALMEAMAAGRPVITTYVAGIPELVIPGETGWLAPAGDVEALARAIRDLLSRSHADLAEMGRAARRRVRERHDINVSAAKLRHFFEAR